MPQQVTEERIDLARRMYVYDKKPRVQIATELDVDIFILNRIAHEQFWDVQREVAIKIENDKDANDPLAQHDRICSSLLRDIERLRQLLAAADDYQEEKRLRNKVESMRSLSEAAQSMVRSHRDARGLKMGQASAATVQEQQGVSYQVVYPTSQQTGTGRT